MRYEVIEIRDNYERTWIAMADGNVSIYNDIKGLELYEYWNLFDSWRKKKEAEANSIREQNKTNKRKHG